MAAAKISEAEAVQKAFRKRHQKINGDKTDTEEVTLDDGLTPGERSITDQIKQEKEADKATDEMLDEAAHIVSDEVGLIHTDTKLATQVLPYHGKKIGATD
jgi:carboxyl-terminal processing protease